ncbi:hypothetical protein WA1_51380 [Scytonema hofmannii PCC 7110]|uniref:Uncharacterized protein n=2 Tax=Scytonema hofmannii TaxID=34078 RepID=A0A139WQ82_9CYAN|nr:hypothetical protein WA1_51380 [Scytonema hofmannii PCC 7110]
MSYRQNRNLVIRHAIIDSLFILWSLIWRTVLGLTFFIIYASLGYVYSWPLYLPIAILLGFSPWGWKVQANQKEKAESRELKKLRNQLGEGIIYTRVESKVEINYRGAIFLKSVFGLFVSGFWGVVLGWKAIWDEIVQLVDNIKTVVKFL